MYRARFDQSFSDLSIGRGDFDPLRQTIAQVVFNHVRSQIHQELSPNPGRAPVDLPVMPGSPSGHGRVRGGDAFGGGETQKELNRQVGEMWSPSVAGDAVGHRMVSANCKALCACISQAGSQCRRGFGCHDYLRCCSPSNRSRSRAASSGVAGC